MLVYGDHVREEDPRAALHELRAALAAPEPAIPIERHGRLAGRFIAAAELAQGLADSASEAAGGDGPSALEDAALALVTPLAEALIASWRALGDGVEPSQIALARLHQAIAALEALPLPPAVRLKTGEGYAYYALYPEAYAEAALRSALGPRTTVIGIRSIGLGLATVVAAACGAPAPLTVRPVGRPFARTLRLTGAMDERLRAAATGETAIVDEGPGLSGSSFGAVADALEARGAPAERLVFFPSHGGDLGPEATPARRARWAASRRPFVTFDHLLLDEAPPRRRLSAWFVDIVGEAAGLEDFSGGAWRERQFGSRSWPGVNSLQERRTFLLQGEGGAFLLKFAGLGAFGERAFQTEARLAAAGFAPEPLALRHGFVGRRWVDATPLALEPGERDAFAAHLGRYLGWRAAHLPAPVVGASAAQLLHMARINAVAALGEGADRARALDPARWADLPPLRPVWTDNRLHLQEWLHAPGGRWLKCDGMDHAVAHDLIGPQDVAWDVAGAVVEFGLCAAEQDGLLSALLEQAPVDALLARALEPAYAAFQYAAHAMAVAAHAHWPQEQARLSAAADRYRDALARRLSA